ncbi:thioredoxin domain-containing protein [Mucilaginibacter sp. Bleaf8]|uniref:vitamin K epoxide reductase family protein n=1 Tax=Mucilaginibacter sp. Bleaf8 TaxID=2834430 RepID=UPI001BCE0CFF|nr:vitamin K epoxide reductase family protein [Mucilaginibacter sp. Bleaf8]MBS7566947.1 thioredoxin domain-containing protein [Mucilaginibacter sp. Bleaf8]
MSIFSFRKLDNTQAVVIKFLELLNIPENDNVVLKKLGSHPEYPSLLSIDDVLTDVGVETYSFQIEREKIEDIPCPFIAHTKSDGFVLVKKSSKQQLVLYNEQKAHYRLNIDQFSEAFDGIVLFAANPSGIKKTIPNSLMVQVKRATVAFALLTLFGLLIYNVDIYRTSDQKSLWTLVALFFLKAAGIFLTSLLLIQGFDANNSFVKKICRINAKTSCENVLSSQAAKAFGGFSWSDVGFVYFTATFFSMLFTRELDSMVRLIYLINIVSLPYTVYSIYYQYKVIKQWCVLCCLVQFVLWMEFITLSINTTMSFSISNLQPVTTLAICFISIVLFWTVTKELIAGYLQLNPLKEQLRKFKYSAKIFDLILLSQPRCILPDPKWCIQIGNSFAKNNIVLVTNPFCPSCKSIHNELDKWLQDRVDLNILIVFAPDLEEKGVKNQMIQHLIALSALENSSILIEAMRDWYAAGTYDYTGWSRKYPVTIDESVTLKSQSHRHWCETTQIQHTPTMFLNSHSLPNTYSLNDLKYLLT